MLIVATFRTETACYKKHFYNSWAEILFGVPQACILGPILFNIFLCDLFLFIKIKFIVSYTDGTTPYTG